MRVVRRVAVILCAGAALVGAAAPTARSADGGSGTYTATGRTYYVTLVNTGTTPWQFFFLVGPAGTVVDGGATVIGESTARCVAGQPDGSPAEIECGPLAAPPSLHFGFVVTLSAPVACGTSFQLDVSSTGVAPFTRVGDVTFAGSCASASPHVVARPTLHGTPTVGKTLTASAPIWSVPPTRVEYQWQLCTTASCSPIRGAMGLTLKLRSRDAGNSVRIVATATLDGTRVTSASRAIAVRARN
jgi:hypothetical protein